MGICYTSVTDLNQNCKPYIEVFSPQKQAESIKAYGFPCVARQPAEKCHDTAPWLQKGSRCPVIHHGELPEIVKNKSQLTPEQITFYSTPQGIVQLNKKGISLALERRVALFFQQSILCHKMSEFTFSAGGADEQIGTSPGMKLTSTAGTSTTHKREAAHSSTIPTLIAHAQDGSRFVYLKGGSSNDQHNATEGMHECVNGADELIDGNGRDTKLRDTAVKILNRVAQENLDPMQATQEFIQALDTQVISIEQNLAEDDKRKFVLERYHTQIGKIQVAAQHKEFYDRLLGVIVNSQDPHEAKIRDIVYRKRFDIIRLQEVIESRIGKRIADAKAGMGVRERSFLEYILLKEFSETNERKIVEKLLGKTAAIFEEEYGKKEDGTAWLTAGEQSSLKKFKTRVDNLQIKYPQLIADLKRDLRADFRELSRAEFTYRAGVFKDFRLRIKNWTQNQFCDHYLATTGSKVSQSWVCRMEQLSRVPIKAPAMYQTPINQRRRYVTVQDAQRCAQTFGVNAGIFLPCLFTSS